MRRGESRCRACSASAARSWTSRWPRPFRAAEHLVGDAMIPIVLKVYDGGKLKSSRAFRAERIRLGSASADLVLESPGIAPTHAVIETGAIGAVLRATTAAPLSLNGQPILAAPLRHGDLISIGELRIMVELQARTLQTLGPQKLRPRLHLIHGEEEPLVDRPHQPAPTLQVVREEILAEVEAATDEGLNDDLNPVPFEPLPVELAPAPAPPPAAPTVPPASESAAVAVRAEPGAPVPTTALPPITTSLGGECAEVELFWGGTRLSVWQLQPARARGCAGRRGADRLERGPRREHRGDPDGHRDEVLERHRPAAEGERRRSGVDQTAPAGGARLSAQSRTTRRCWTRRRCRTR